MPRMSEIVTKQLTVWAGILFDVTFEFDHPLCNPLDNITYAFFLMFVSSASGVMKLQPGSHVSRKLSRDLRLKE